MAHAKVYRLLMLVTDSSLKGKVAKLTQVAVSSCHIDSKAPLTSVVSSCNGYLFSWGDLSTCLSYLLYLNWNTTATNTDAIVTGIEKAVVPDSDDTF